MASPKLMKGGDKNRNVLSGNGDILHRFYNRIYKGWKLTLVILAISPVLGLSAAIWAKVGVKPVNPGY